jgi:hypothetical protein
MMMPTASRATLVPVALVVIAVVAGCADDPTTSTAYEELEQELVAAESSLLEAEKRLANLSQECDATDVEAGVAADMVQMQEAWLEAWSAGDGDAVLAMMAPGGRHYCPASGPQGVSGSGLRAFVEHEYVMTDSKIVSAVCTQLPGDPAAVRNDCLVVTEGTLNGHPGYTTVLHLRGLEGSLRVVDHHAYP